MAVAGGARGQAVEEIKGLCEQLRKLIPQANSATIPVSEIRKYEDIAFEKCREMILDGADPATVKNPYEVKSDGTG